MAKTVEETIEGYVQGVINADVDLLRSVFLPDARMWGYLGDNYVSEPIEEFFAVVANTNTPKLAGWASAYSHVIRSVEVTGDAGVAVLEETGYLGGDFTNYFSVMRRNGTWAIASKTFFLTGGDPPPHPD